MKFKFCGDLDAPDWILKEISIISKISFLKVRIIAGQVVNHILGAPVDYDKISKSVADANLEISDIKATLAAINFIINNAAKFDVEEQTLANELAQLGMPKEHCDSICKVYREGKDRLRASLYEKVLSLPRLESLDWRVDSVLATDTMSDLSVPAIHLKLTVKNPDGTTRVQTFEVTEDKFKVLVAELRTARQIMDSVE